MWVSIYRVEKRVKRSLLLTAYENVSTILKRDGHRIAIQHDEI